MPVKFDQPQEKVVQEQLTESFDEIKINIYTVNNDKQKIDVIYSKFLEGEELDGKLGILTIDGQDFVNIAMAAPNGATRYEDIKNVLYIHLLDKLGLVGTIE